jgi:hypothetical protein
VDLAGSFWPHKIKARRNRSDLLCNSGALKSVERLPSRSKVCLYLYRPWFSSCRLSSCHPLPACSACLPASLRAEAVRDELAALLPALAEPVAAGYRQEAALPPADDCQTAAVVSLPVAQAYPAAQQVCWHRAELAQDEPAALQRRAVLRAALPGEHSNFHSAGSRRYRQVSPEAPAGRVHSAAPEPVAARSPQAVLQEPAQVPVLHFRWAEAAALGDCRYYSLAARRLRAPAAQFSPQELEQRQRLSPALPCELH